MDNTACIILNYNDADTAMGLVRELRGSREISRILVVDNCSTDDSWERLQTLRPFAELVRTDRNGGYGWGNQEGVDVAVRLWNPDFVIIANPDIHVSDRCIRKVKEALERTKEAAVGSALVSSPDGKRLFSYWDLLPLVRDLLDTGPVTRRVFRPWLITPPGRLPRGGTAGSRLVGAVPGSFLVIKMDRLSEKERRNLFDRQVFLYCEEKILGRKLQAAGKKTVLVTDGEYVHAHSVSIDRNVAGIAAKQKLLHESKLYYYRHYLKAGPAAMAGARLFLAAVYAEVWILTRVFHMKW